MSSVIDADSEDKVLSHWVKEDINMRFDKEGEALGTHPMEANRAAVSRSLRLVLPIPIKEDLANTHLLMVCTKEVICQEVILNIAQRQVRKPYFSCENVPESSERGGGFRK